MRYGNILEAIGNTPLVELPRLTPNPNVHIYAKLEGNNPTGSVKDRIAKYMIDDGEKSGALKPGQTILEPTSGNTGISLAMIGHYKGYPVKTVMPESVSIERRQILEAYGAEVILSPGDLGSNGSIKMALEIHAKHPEYYMPYQYGNEANPRAHYETTAAEIIRDLPEVDVFMAGQGTGGTLMGNGRRLKEHNPNLKLIAVVPHPGDLVQGLRSLDDGFIPPIMDVSLLDGKILVASKEAFAMTAILMEREGIFAGISAGSVVYGAMRQAQRMESGHIVCLLADGGWKYLSTGLWSDPSVKDTEGLDNKIWW
ncbi:MAG: cysteine synthase family protein [Dehalococcoidia bacterium]|nr:cysteine synthase family protein [Dehalococcoidia bacterium]